MFFLQNTKAERGKKFNIYEYAQLKHVSHVFTSPFFFDFKKKRTQLFVKEKDQNGANHH